MFAGAKALIYPHVRQDMENVLMPQAANSGLNVIRVMNDTGLTSAVRVFETQGITNFGSPLCKEEGKCICVKGVSFRLSAMNFLRRD